MYLRLSTIVDGQSSFENIADKKPAVNHNVTGGGDSCAGKIYIQPDINKL